MLQVSFIHTVHTYGDRIAGTTVFNYPVMSATALRLWRILSPFPENEGCYVCQEPTMAEDKKSTHNKTYNFGFYCSLMASVKGYYH